MVERKKGDRKLSSDREKMERAEADEKVVDTSKRPGSGTKDGLIEPLIYRRELQDGDTDTDPLKR